MDTLRIERVFWFIIAGELGGLCGVIIGFSLISAVEVVYFLIRQFCLAIRQHYHRRQYSAKVEQVHHLIFFH